MTLTLPLPEGPAWNGGTHSFVLLDCETSGLSPETARVVEVAAVRFELNYGEWLTDVYNIIVLPEPGFVMPAEASTINGITQEMVNAGLPFADAWRAIAARCAHEGVAVAAYNADFDRKFLSAEVKRLGIPKADIPEAIKAPWLDPLVWVRARDRFVKGPGRHKLTTTCARWGIPIENAHRATGDATAAGKLLLSKKMAETIETGCFRPNPSLEHVLFCQAHLGDHQERERREYVSKLQHLDKLANKTAAILGSRVEGEDLFPHLPGEGPPTGDGGNW